MNYGKNIIATILICGVVSTVAFAAAKAPSFKLDDKTIKCKIENGEIWVRVPKNFVSGTLVNESNRKLKLTEENFDKVNKEGTTYETICKIFGGKGKLQDKTVTPDPDSENGKHVRASYIWEDDCTTVEFDLVNGKVFRPEFNEWRQNFRPSLSDLLSRLEQITPKQ